MGIQQTASSNSINLQTFETVQKTEEKKAVQYSSPGLFSDEELVLDEILSVNPDEMSPIEALLCVSRWKKALSGR